MSVEDVVEIVAGLADEGVVVWVDGGWCIEALVGRELREHGDLDLAVRRGDEEVLRAWLDANGFKPRSSAEDSAWSYVLSDDRGRTVDVHVFEFNSEGVHVYGIEYPADSLTGRASLAGVDVHCIAPGWMFTFKTSYTPSPKDLLDVQALADKFGYEIPPTHQTA